jgi:hypothetical protein
MQNSELRIARTLLLSSFFILNSAFCIHVFANDLSVDRHSLRVGESLTITLSLEDAFATIDDVEMPARNLLVSPTPSVSSEFSWINGSVVRRKVFRFAARAVQPGAAQVGPLTITLPDGERESFPAIALQILPDRAAGSNDPVTVLRELLGTGRDPFFVVTEMDKTQAVIGEQVVVTWWLYNAASVQEWQIGSVPKLAEFWVEEVDVRSAQPLQTFVSDYAMQKMPIRRVALYALRSGTLPIGSMEVDAAVMRRTTSGPFGLFEGNVVDVSFSSAPLSLTIHPRPAGAAPLVGDLNLRCSPPRQKNGGPVLIDATLTGRGNLRSASPPRFERPPAADVQLVERGASLDRAVLPSMTRRWQFVLFPARAGALAIPAMTLTEFSPATGANRVLRCEGSTINVAAVDRIQTVAQPSSPSTRVTSSIRKVLLIAIALAVIVFLASAIATLVARWRSVSRRISQIVDDRSPSQIRDAVHERLVEKGIDVASLMRERSDRGDAYRALRSLLDALEHERMIVNATELQRRVRELLESLQSAA